MHGRLLAPHTILGNINPPRVSEPRAPSYLSSRLSQKLKTDVKFSATKFLHAPKNVGSSPWGSRVALVGFFDLPFVFESFPPIFVQNTRQRLDCWDGILKEAMLYRYLIEQFSNTCRGQRWPTRHSKQSCTQASRFSNTPCGHFPISALHPTNAQFSQSLWASFRGSPWKEHETGIP